MKKVLRKIVFVCVCAFTCVTLVGCDGPDGKTTGYSADDLDGGVSPMSRYVATLTDVERNPDGDLTLGYKGFYMEGLHYVNSDAEPAEGDRVFVWKKYVRRTRKAYDEYFLYLCDPSVRKSRQWRVAMDFFLKTNGKFANE